MGSKGKIRSNLLTGSSGSVVKQSRPHESYHCGQARDEGGALAMGQKGGFGSVYNDVRTQGEHSEGLNCLEQELCLVHVYTALLS